MSVCVLCGVYVGVYVSASVEVLCETSVRAPRLRPWAAGSRGRVDSCNTMHAQTSRLIDSRRMCVCHICVQETGTA